MSKNTILKVSEQGFDKIINSGLKLKSCQICGINPRIVIDYPIYGKHGVKFECPNCGYEKEVYLHSMPIADDERFGTPTTIKSLAKSIFEVVGKWNAEQRAEV